MPSADAQPEEAALAPVSARVFALFERDVALRSQTEIATPAAASLPKRDLNGGCLPHR